MQRVWALIWFAAGLLGVSAARAELTVQITRGQDDAVPIAIVPLGGSAAPVDIAQVVAADLVNSGRFKALDRARMSAKPSRGDQIRFPDWREVNFIVVGEVTRDGGDRYTARYELFNVLNGQRLIEKTEASTAAGLRALAHRISDAVFLQLTGIRGAFSTRIAYVKVEGLPPKRRYKLMVADADGVNEREATSSTEPLMSPSWSPDGQNLAYVSFESRASAIYVQNLRTGERRRVSARSGINGAPAWSPDGRTLALTLSRKDGDVDIYTLELQNQTLTRMTFDPGIDTEPVWSLDGRKLYFTSDRAGGPQIYEVEVSQPQRPTRLTFDGSYNARPRLSPDGKQLAVVYLDNGNYRIAIVDLASRNVRVLTQGRQEESPSFAPNGAMVIYATQERGRGVLSVASVDGKFTGRLGETSGDVREPVWSPFPQSSDPTRR